MCRIGSVYRRERQRGAATQGRCSLVPCFLTGASRSIVLSKLAISCALARPGPYGQLPTVEV